MQRRTFVRLAGGALAAAVGCRSLTRAHRVPYVPGYRRRLGSATWYDIRDHVGDMLLRHQYVPLRVDGPPAIYIETEWRQREPFDDEKEHGAEQARTRLVLSARVSGRKVNEFGELYDLDVLIENQSRKLHGDWGDGGLTPEFLSYATRIANDLETGFRAKVRIY